MTPDEGGLRCACGCEFLGAREAADVLGLSVGGVRNLASQGGMPGPVGRISGHSPVWLAADVHRLAAERRANGKSRPRKSRQRPREQLAAMLDAYQLGDAAEDVRQGATAEDVERELREMIEPLPQPPPIKTLDSKLTEAQADVLRGQAVNLGMMPPSVALEALDPSSRTETENQSQTELQTDQPTSYPSSGTSNAEPIAKPEHLSLGLEMDGRRYIGRCSCGWSTPRMASEMGATTRLELHLA